MTNLRDEARWLIGEISEAKRLARAGGKPQLANSAIEAGRIEEYDQDGTLVQIVGEQHDGTHTPVTVNGPVPPEPSAPAITAGIGSVEGRWSGKFAGDALSPMDLSHVALHASRAEVFTPSNETQLATITGELGDVAVVLMDSGEWTFGLVAVSKAGKWSGLSETVTIDVPDFPSPVDIQDELIRFDEVTGGLITEAGNLGNRLDGAEEDLAAHETRLGANDATIANLTGTVLPQLQTDLNKAKTDLAPLPGLIQQNTTKVNEAKTRLDKLDSTTLPGLAADLAEAKNRLADTESTLAPLPGKIAEAQSDMVDAFGQLGTVDSRINTAKTQAAADAQNKANAAKQAAIEAAAATAELKASGAKADAIAAAETRAKQLADAAEAAALAAAKADATAKADAAKQAAITAAAADAQGKADAARAEAQRQIEQLIARGQSLVRNGDFEAGSDGWQITTAGFWSVETGTSRSGTQAMRLGPNPGGNVWPTSEWVPSSTGRSYYFEYWAKRSGDEAKSNTARTVVQSKTVNGGTSTLVVGPALNASDISTTTWTKVSGTYTITTADATHVRFAPWFIAANNVYYVDDFLAIDVTEAQVALAAAETAKQNAAAALAAAGSAKDTADHALTMAGSKSRAFYSTGNPSGTGETAGDVWRKIDGDKNVVAEWYWTGLSWQATQITNEMISNLDVGKLTAGSAIIQTAVINKIAAQAATIIELNADRITAGKLGAARIDVANLAAEIATVIQLNAGSITAGTLSADRLDANAVAAKIATVIQLNASRITAGTINTARLNVSEIAAQVATVIQLNADRIMAGTIATARLNAQEIAAATAAFQTVDVKNLFATTGTMAEAVINKLWADVVMSRKITTQMLAVGDFNNMASTGLEPGGTRATGWAAGLIVDTADKPAEALFSLKSTAGQGTYTPPAPYDYFDVAPGDELVFSVWVKSSLPNSRFYQEIRDQLGAHAVTWSAIPGKLAMSPNASYPMGGGVNVPTTWTQYWAKGIVKAGVTQLAIRSVYFNHSSGTERNAVVSIAGMSLRRMLAGEMVIDGSLKAAKIDTADLAANTGFIADLTARIVKSEMFVGKEFFGGKFIGSYFWTDAAEAVGLKLDNQGLRVYGAEGGEPVTEIRANGGTVYSITDPATGDTLASLDRDGVVSGQELNIAGDPVFLGSPLLGDTVNFQHPSEFETPGLLDVLPRGMIARGFRNISDRTSVTNQEMEILEYNYVHEPGRGYRITVAPFSAYVGGGNAYGYLNVYVTTDGTRPSMSSTPTFRQYVRNQASGAELATFGGVFYNTGYQPAPRVVRIMITISSEGGTLSFHPNALASTVRTWVEDMGLSAPDTSIDRNGRMDLSVPTPVPPPEPPPVPKENYTQVWKATGYRSFDGNGRYTYADGTNKIYQGTAGYTGMLRSMVTFGTGSKGQTIIQALSGAKINSIKVTMRFDHWWSSAGGTAQIMLHGSASLTSAPPAMTLAATSSKWPKPGTRTVSIPSSRWEGFKNGDWKGIGLGNGSSGTAYYGYARASSVSLEIKYTK